jgi:hypothetical protein
MEILKKNGGSNSIWTEKNVQISFHTIAIFRENIENKNRVIIRLTTGKRNNFITIPTTLLFR